MTLILITDEADLAGGTKLTFDICTKLFHREQKPFAVVPLNARGLPQARRTLKQLPTDGVLNIAGPRESQRPGIYARAKEFIQRLLKDASSS